MQRIISMQTFRNADNNGASEFVSKRLCFSFLFSVAFLSLLGGFLLGRYVTDRALLLKNAILQQKQRTEESTSIDALDDIAATVRRINNLTAQIVEDGAAVAFDFDSFRGKLLCTNRTTASIQELPNEFDRKFSWITNRVVNLHLRALHECLRGVLDYLENWSDGS